MCYLHGNDKEIETLGEYGFLKGHYIFSHVTLTDRQTENNQTCIVHRYPFSEYMYIMHEYEKDECTVDS